MSLPLITSGGVLEPLTITFTTPTTSATVANLVPGATYTFRVSSTNALGYSSQPATVSITIPSTGVPDAPIIGQAVVGNGIITLTWAAPINLGTPALSAYVILVYDSSGNSISQIPVGNIVSYGLTGGSGLTSGSLYTFKVIGSNTIGYSTQSSATSPPVMFATAPAQPTGLTGTSPSSSNILLSWGAPSSGTGSIPTLTYSITYNNPTPITYTTSATSYQIGGLSNGVNFTFSVYATNVAGLQSTAATLTTQSSATITAPSAPIIGSASINSNTGIVTVSWTGSSSNGGSPITSYTSTAYITGTSNAGPVQSAGSNSSNLTYAVGTLLNNTSYYFTVSATNSASNTSVQSGPTNSIVTLNVPGAPTGVTAAAGNALATVQWAVPSTNGGSPITGYTATSFLSPSGVTGPSSTVSGSNATSVDVTGLTNGSAYTFSVRATNPIGNSVESTRTIAVTPIALTVPGAPTGVSAVAGNARATVSWTVPASNGGSAITGYTATSFLSPSGVTGPTSTVSGSNATSVAVTGLTNGTAYTFSVRATNIIGNSVESARTIAVTPFVPVPVTGNDFVGQRGVIGFADGTGTSATFTLIKNFGCYPLMTITNLNTIYLTDILRNIIRIITPSAVVTSFDLRNAGNSGPDTSFTNVCFDSSNNMYYGANELMKRTPGGVTSIFVGTVAFGGVFGAYYTRLTSLTINSAGNIYVTLFNNSTNTNTIFMVTPSGVVTTFAILTLPPASGSIPLGASCLDSAGNIYVCATASSVILKITPEGTSSVFAGSGSVGFQDGIGTAASFNLPFGIFCSPSNILYVADVMNNRVRIITISSATVTTLNVNDFNNPCSVCLDSSNNLFVADSENAVIRKFIL